MTNYNILIVEDEFIPAHYLKKILVHSGHNVIAITNSKESALRHIGLQAEVDLTLMDIKIKGDADGIQVAKAIQSGSGSAILFISAYSSLDFLERAKEINSIGYLVKPVQPDTLLSTIEIGMSRFKSDKLKNIVTLCEDAVFDIDTQIIKKKRNIIDLSHHESSILTILLKNRNRLVTVLELEKLLCEDKPLGQGALRTAIWRLRKKLPACVSIENIYNSGYKITF